MSVGSKYRGGPYTFTNTLIAARANSVVGNNATIRVKSNFYPVTMTVAGEDVTATFPSDTPVVVSFASAGAGTYTCTFVEAASAGGPQNGTETLSVTIS